MQSCALSTLRPYHSAAKVIAAISVLVGLARVTPLVMADESGAGNEVGCAAPYRRVDLARPLQLEAMHYMRCDTLGEWSMTTVPFKRPDASSSGALKGTEEPQPPIPQGSFGCTSADSVSHTDASFEGGQYFVQAGFEQGEIAAASYTLPAGTFPIQINTVEGIFAQQAAVVQTTTHWSLIVWEGYPNTGTIVATYSSDDVILPHLVLPPGTQGANILVQVDPSDPEQIIVNNNGTNTFSVGYRIDQLNVPGNPCLSPPPSNQNAFPTTDTSGLASPGGNWIDAIDGVLCCPSGWHSFQTFPAGCRPSGDWVIRASYCSVSGTQVGACCTSNGMCIDNLDDLSCANLPGNFQGGGTVCSGLSCPDLLGACCDEDGMCTDGLNASGCTAINGDFEGPATTCGMTMCDQPTGACCIPPTGCLPNAPEASCTAGNFTYAGNGSQCPSGCQKGACCFLDGSCDFIIEHECDLASGAFTPGGTCMPNMCPQPTGACCINGICFPQQTEADCLAVGTNGIDASWVGMDTICVPSPCSSDTQPPSVVGALSYHSQGDAGSYAVDILAGETECRLGGPSTVLIYFDEQVAAADGDLADNDDVLLSSGMVIGEGIAANVLAVTMENVANAECLTLDLSGITDLAGNPSVQTLALPVLYGDADNDGMVGTADAAAISAASSPDAVSTEEQARRDVNLDGVVGVGDLTATMAVSTPGQVTCP